MENTMIIREDEVEKILHSLDMKVTTERMTELIGVFHNIFKSAEYTVSVVQKFRGQESLELYEVEDYIREYREKILYNQVGGDTRYDVTPKFDIRKDYFMIFDYEGKIMLYMRKGGRYEKDAKYCLVRKEQTKEMYYTSLLIQQVILEYEIMECATPPGRERLVGCLARLYNTNTWPNYTMYDKIKQYYEDEYPDLFDRELKVQIFEQALRKIASPHMYYEKDEHPDFDEVRQQAKNALTKKEFIPEEPKKGEE